jgi:hypothetical protein
MPSPTSSVTTAKELLAAYRRGVRQFKGINLDRAQLAGVDLTAASFYGASLRAVDLTDATLTYVQFKGADLTGACLSNAFVNATDLIGATFIEANLTKVHFIGACLARADCTRADMRSAYFGNASLADAIFVGANVEGASLSSTYLDDVDVSVFCEARKLKHSGPSSIDFRTVMKTYRHPNLKQFIVDCGVPEIFATYMIDCARALGEPLMRSLMQSTFISYGGPDEAFARRLYDALRAHGVVVFFFPEGATVGERIDNEVFRRIQEHDRVLLVCSRESLNRAGVVNEIQETLDREARDGGATYLLPIMLDDYVLDGWSKTHPELAKRVGLRIIGDFRKTKRNKAAFDNAMARVVDALKVKRPK